MHGASGFYHPSDSAEALADGFLEVADLDLGGHRVFVLPYQREAGKAGGNIGNGGRYAAMDEADLLLVYLGQVDHGFHVAGLDHGELAADVFHELLTVQMVPDDLSESRCFRDEFHGAKIPRPRGLQGMT